MTKDIPEIDDLTKGINDPDISLTDEPQDQSGAQESSAQEISLKVENLVPFMDNIDKCWNSWRWKIWIISVPRHGYLLVNLRSSQKEKITCSDCLEAKTVDQHIDIPHYCIPFFRLRPFLGSPAVL